MQPATPCCIARPGGRVQLSMMPSLPLAPTLQLGVHGPRTAPLALGCMGMSGMYGHAEEAESIRTIHAALDAGIDFLDTGDFYGMGHNELLVGRALRDAGPSARDKVHLSVKFGAQRGPDGQWLGYDTRPAAVKTWLAYSLVRLGVDHIDTYRPARLDPAVPIEDTIGAIADLIKEGYVRHIGLSEVGPGTIRRAHATHPISDLQIEYAVVSRKPETTVFPVLRELGIGVTAYGVLSRGLLSGSRPGGKGDFRGHLPRFAGQAGESNQKLFETLQLLAANKGMTPTQLAIAWVVANSGGHAPAILPVVGSRTVVQLEEALGALNSVLAPDEMLRIAQALPEVVGTRYDPRQMAVLDSERE